MSNLEPHLLFHCAQTLPSLEPFQLKARGQTEAAGVSSVAILRASNTRFVGQLILEGVMLTLRVDARSSCEVRIVEASIAPAY